MAKRIKTGGRTKGTPNKKTEALFDKCDRLGLDVFDGLLELCNDEDKNLRLAALRECASYLYPKRKALELSGDAENPLSINSGLEKLRKEIKAEEDERK